jgi:hypothetical protein
MTDLTVAEIKGMLKQRAKELARHLAPGGTLLGALYSAKNPTRADRHAGSFKIHASGPKAGGFVDYAESGCRGDVIDLIAYCRFGAYSLPPSREQRIEAIQWAKSWLGLSDMSPKAVQHAVRQASAAQKQADAEAQRDAERKYKQALEIWLRAGSPIGTVVETYLRSRAIDLATISNKEYSLRFAPAQQHFHVKHIGPAMLAKVVDAKGLFAAVHITWLAEDGSDKADLEGLPLLKPDKKRGIFTGHDVKQKLILGAMRGKGCVIRLTRGASGLTPEEAAEQGVSGLTGVGEGVEDVYSVAMGRADLRLWAAASLSNLPEVPRLPCVSDFLVFADNDWGKPQAMAGLDKGCEALRATGAGVAVARAFVGKDFNDQLRGRA